jgi:hypothetical protein
MPSLAEAEAVMASEASSAAAIRTKRLIWFFSPSRDRDRAQFPDEWVCSPGPKLNPQCDIRASDAAYSPYALPPLTDRGASPPPLL